MRNCVRSKYSTSLLINTSLQQGQGLKPCYAKWLLMVIVKNPQQPSCTWLTLSRYRITGSYTEYIDEMQSFYHSVGRHRLILVDLDTWRWLNMLCRFLHVLQGRQLLSVFLFAFLHNKSILKRSQFFPFWVDPFKEGSQNNFEELPPFPSPNTHLESEFIS